MALVALHGSVDLLRIERVAVYAFVILQIPYSVYDSIAFAVASIAHFALDSSLLESLALHIVLLTLHLMRCTDIAVRVLLVHFMVIHIPHLVILAWEADATSELCILTCAAIVAFLRPWWVCRRTLDAREEKDGDGFRLSWKLQRLIVCHVLASVLFP